MSGDQWISNGDHWVENEEQGDRATVFYIIKGYPNKLTILPTRNSSRAKKIFFKIGAGK